MILFCLGFAMGFLTVPALVFLWVFVGDLYDDFKEKKARET